MIKPIALCAATAAAIAISIPERTGAEPQSNWHFLSQTYGGTISLLKNLTKEQCDFAYNRAKGYPATADEREARKRIEEKQRAESERFYVEHPECKNVTLTYPVPSGCWSISTAYSSAYAAGSGDIKYAECFQ